MWYVYILYSKSSKLFYTGYSEDLKRRFTEHNSGKSRFTKTGIPWKLIYYEAYLTKELATQREAQLKKRGQQWTYLLKRIVPKEVYGGCKIET